MLVLFALWTVARKMEVDSQDGKDHRKVNPVFYGMLGTQFPRHEIDAPINAQMAMIPPTSDIPDLLFSVIWAFCWLSLLERLI